MVPCRVVCAVSTTGGGAGGGRIARVTLVHPRLQLQRETNTHSSSDGTPISQHTHITQAQRNTILTRAQHITRARAAATTGIHSGTQAYVPRSRGDGMLYTAADVSVASTKPEDALLFGRTRMGTGRYCAAVR